MTIAVGVAKTLAYKAESTWGTAAGASGAQLLRRITSDLSLTKQTYQSNEIRSDYQIADFRHGVRSVSGAIAGELSAGTWKDFIAAAVRKAFVSVSAITGLSITVASAGSVNGFATFTVSRAAGSWLSDGIKAGNIVRLTAGSLNAANLNKNLLVLSAVAADLTVLPLNGVAMVAEGPVASCTLSVPGKKTYVPTTGHTDPSFTFEHYFSDLTLSEVFTGCKIGQLTIGLPPTGIATVGLDILGKDITTAGSQYFSSPTAETSTGVLAAVNGIVAVQGSPVALLTGLTLNVKGDMQPAIVVGSNSPADMSEGRVTVDGQFMAYFSSATQRDYFVNETEISLFGAFTSSGSAGADFVAFSMPRIKVGSATKDDGEKGLVETFSFQALYNSTGGSGTATEQSTIAFQDSQA